MSAFGDKADLRGRRYHRAVYRFSAVIPTPRMGYMISAMQMMRLLAMSGVIAAAGAMISLWFAVSPSLTFLPPLPVPVDASGTVASQQHQSIETMGAAIDDSLVGRGQVADNDIPPIPAPKRDPLEGLIGGL